MSADEYSKLAEECRQHAEKAMSGLDKERWLQLAESWLRLADDASWSGRVPRA